MAKGKEKHEEYKRELSLLGKQLTRRAKSRCELSGKSGSLLIYDLKGGKVEPSLDHVVYVSEEVKAHLEGVQENHSQLHYLETAVWSSEPAVRLAAITILQQIDEIWARDALENASLMNKHDVEQS